MAVMEIGRETNPDGFFAGNGTIDQVAMTLSEVSVPVLKHVVVRAAAGNTGTIAIAHNEAQAANGFLLAEGETSPPIYVNDAAKIWIVGSDDGQDYSWIAN